MPEAYSYDLRIKVMKFLEEKNTTTLAASVFSIARKTIIEWKKIKEETKDVKAKVGYQRGHRRIIRDIDKFKEFIEANKDKPSRELARLWHQNVCASTIVKTLGKLGYSYKKNFYSPQKGRWHQG